MLKLSTIILSWCMFLSGCTGKKDEIKLILDETFNQSSSLAAYNDHLMIVDTAFGKDGTVERIEKHVYVFRNDTLVEQGLSMAKDTSLKYDVIVANAGQYEPISDTTSKIWSEVKHEIANIYQLRETGLFMFALAKNSTGNCDLHIYDKKKKNYNKVELGNYTDYSPQLVLHDFNDDGIPEILVLANFYLQNHYLVNVRGYELLK